MLSAVGEVKIGDFGVSRKMNPLEKCYEQCGTPAYIAPELLSADGYSGFKADMWSAGCLLYAMLVGSVPFKAGTVEELHALIQSAKYDFKFQSGSRKHNGSVANKFSESVRDLIGRLLTVDPSKRLSAKEALEHPWLKDAATYIADLFTEKE